MQRSLIIDKNKIKTIDDLDARFKGLQSFFNWYQDFESELHEAGRCDHKYDRTRISVCEEFLKRFASEDLLRVGNTRRAIVESLFAIGEVREGEALLKEWLNRYPKWGWGWVDWSDCHIRGQLEYKDYQKAEEILKKALEIPGIMDEDIILDRLHYIYSETNRRQEASAVKKKLDSLGR